MSEIKCVCGHTKNQHTRYGSRKQDGGNYKRYVGCSYCECELIESVFTESEVREIVQTIYSEFAELPLNRHTTASLRNIIELEVEKNPLRPIQIFAAEVKEGEQ